MLQTRRLTVQSDLTGTEPTGAGDDLCGHQVFVIVRLALYALEPTIELLICFNRQRNKSLTLITSMKTHRLKPEADERRYDTTDSCSFPAAGGQMMICSGLRP